MIFRNLEIGKKIISKRGLPAHIVLFITNRCNMECDHCFLVESGELNDMKRPQILSVENLRKLATSNPKLLALSITGGEPFLRKDLYKIVNLFKKQVVAIPTNGFLTDNIIDRCKNKII